MSIEIIKLSVQGSAVGYRKEDGYLNATALTKAYFEVSGKQKNVADWLRLKRTKETLQHASTVTGIPITELYQVVQGGNPENQGTWIHPKLRARFASWVSDEFGYMVEELVEKIEQGEIASTDKPPQNEFSLLGSAIDMILAPLRIDERLQAGIRAEAIAAQCPELRPAIEATKKHLLLPTESKLLSPTELGQLVEPAISARKMNALLISLGLQQKTGDKQCPYIAVGRGLDHAELVADTAKGHAKTVQKLRWYESVLELLK